MQSFPLPHLLNKDILYYLRDYPNFDFEVKPYANSRLMEALLALTRGLIINIGETTRTSRNKAFTDNYINTVMDNQGALVSVILRLRE